MLCITKFLAISLLRCLVVPVFPLINLITNTNLSIRNNNMCIYGCLLSIKASSALVSLVRFSFPNMLSSMNTPFSFQLYFHLIKHVKDQSVCGSFHASLPNLSSHNMSPKTILVATNFITQVVENSLSFIESQDDRPNSLENHRQTLNSSLTQSVPTRPTKLPNPILSLVLSLLFLQLNHQLYCI